MISESTVLLVDLEEPLGEVLVEMRASHPELSHHLDCLDRVFLLELVSYLALLALNSQVSIGRVPRQGLIDAAKENLLRMIRTPDYMQLGCYPLSAMVDEFVDELTTTICADIFSRIKHTKSIYAVQRVESVLHIKLLVSEEALEYQAFDPTELIILVTKWNTSS